MPLTEEELKKIEEDKKELAGQISDMSGWTAAPGTEAPSTESPGTEVPTTEAPEEEFETEAPTTEAPTGETEAPTTEAPEIEESEEMVGLRAQAAELVLLKESKIKTDAPPTAAPTTDAPVDDVDFLTGLTEEDLQNPKVLNIVLNTVLKKGIAIGKNVSTEHILRSIPSVMENVVSQQLTLKGAADKFYDDNKDLTPHKNLMALQAQKLGSANPEWTIDKLFKESGDAVRKTIGLKKQTKVKKDEKMKKPVFAKKTKSKQKVKDKPKLSPLQEEIAKMNDAKTD